MRDAGYPSDYESEDMESDEEDHAFMFDPEVPSEQICASHAKREYGGTSSMLTVHGYDMGVSYNLCKVVLTLKSKR